MAEDAWKQHAEALGQAVIARRVELGHRTRESFSQETGLTVKTLGEIERGVRPSYSPSTLATVDQKLRWPAGTAQALLRGEQPPPQRTEPPADDEAKLAAEFSTLRGLLGWIHIDDSRLALMLEISGLSTEDMWDVVKMIRIRRTAQLDEVMGEIRDELRRRGAPAPDHPETWEWIDEWVARRKGGGTVAPPA